MTTRTVIAALGLAILLGGIAWLIMGGGGGGPPAATLGAGDLIADVDAFSARYVRVVHPDGRVEEARRESINAPWLLTIAPSSSAAGGPETSSAWNLAPAKITQFLRILQNTTARAVPEKGSSIGNNPLTLELPAPSSAPTAEGGATDERGGGDGGVRIRFGGRRLGGNVLAEITDPARGGGKEPYLAVIDEDIVSALTEPGLSGWRETAVLPDAAQLASRLTLSRPNTSFTVARINGRWRITSPFGAPADQAKIPHLLRSLEAVRITNFLDARQPTLDAAGLDEPIATVRLESDRPDGTITRTLTIGAPVSMGGEPGEVYALIGDNPHIVRIDAAPLTSLPGAAVALVNPAATAVPVTEIFNIALKRLDASAPDMVFRKELERWGEVNTAGDVLVLDDTGAAQIGELLQFLTAVQPEQIRASAPDAFMPLGAVTLGSLGASPLDEITIGVLPTEDSVSVVLATNNAGSGGDGAGSGGDGGGSVGEGGVHRVYAEGRTPLIIRRFLSGKGGAFAPIEAAEPSSDPSAK